MPSILSTKVAELLLNALSAPLPVAGKDGCVLDVHVEENDPSVSWTVETESAVV